ncbi:MAG: sugar transferase [Bacteroidales bacterium]|nr:sugar transferase [Bacteroidales bacterium]
MNSKKIHAGLYVGVDFLSAVLAWMLFFIHRKSLETGGGFSYALDVVWNDLRLYQGLIVIPLGWLFLYSAYGYYRKPFAKTLFTDFTQTLSQTIIGVIVLFFIVILDDYVESYNWYYNYVFMLFVLHFGLTLFGRMVHTYCIQKRVQNNDFLLLLDDDPLPAWQNFLKRIGDIVLSIVMIVLLFPLILLVIWKIKRDSKGPIFYLQERIGLDEKPFMMYKFRSMHENAEVDNLPMLSSDNDERVTLFGRFMRKYRVDELPQFWNVLKGDMSLVGPRPERQYFIDQIVKKAPEYKRLLCVKPGVTSWGEVKYGYASSVDEMIERMDFDLQYIDNMSLSNDVKILFYTVGTVLKGEGK